MAAGLNGRPGGHGEFFCSRSEAGLLRYVDEWTETHHLQRRTRVKPRFHYGGFLCNFPPFLALYWRSQ